MLRIELDERELARTYARKKESVIDWPPCVQLYVRGLDEKNKAVEKRIGN